MEWTYSQTKFIKDIETAKLYIVENKKGKLAVIKKISKYRASGLNYRNEIEILEKLNHPNIITTYGHYENFIKAYQVLEYIEGMDLFDVLGKTPFTPDLALNYLREIKSGLDYIHSKNIIHRDIKLENIMVRGFDRNIVDIKIIDFGYAIEITDDMMYYVCGTIDYLSPEMVLGKTYDQTIDLWSLGVIGFELINLKPPFHSSTDEETKNKIKQRYFQFTPDFPYEYGKIINKLLSFDPEKRSFDF